MNRYRVDVEHRVESQSGRTLVITTKVEVVHVLAVTKDDAIIQAFDTAADLNLDVWKINPPEFVGEA